MSQDPPNGQIQKPQDGNSMSGYLYKKTKDGRWQKRWFETNGIYLTYYKTRKMEKLLAALSLPQVGEIKVLKEGDEVGLFSIELNTRIYTLRAKTNEEAQEWVDSLKRLREQGASTTSVNVSDKAGLAANMEGGKTEWLKGGSKSSWCC